MCLCWSGLEFDGLKTGANGKPCLFGTWNSSTSARCIFMSMAWFQTAVSPLLTHRRYYSLALSHRYIVPIKHKFIPLWVVFPSPSHRWRNIKTACVICHFLLYNSSSEKCWTSLEKYATGCSASSSLLALSLPLHQRLGQMVDKTSGASNTGFICNIDMDLIKAFWQSSSHLNIWLSP